MWRYIISLFMGTRPFITIDSVYGCNFTPDVNVAKKRAQKVEAIKKRMGSKYLLHTPVERKDGRD